MPVLGASALFSCFGHSIPFPIPSCMSTCIAIWSFPNSSSAKRSPIARRPRWPAHSAMARCAVDKDFRLLLHAAILLGIASTIAYWAVRDEMSARETSAAARFRHFRGPPGAVGSGGPGSPLGSCRNRLCHADVAVEPQHVRLGLAGRDLLRPPARGLGQPTGLRFFRGAWRHHDGRLLASRPAAVCELEAHASRT